MGDPRKDDLVQVAQHGIHGFPLLGRLTRQLRPDGAWFHRRDHRQFLDPFEVLSQPVNGGVTLPVEPPGSCGDSSRSRSSLQDHGQEHDTPNATDS